MSDTDGGGLEDANGTSAVPGLVVFQQPEIGLYQRLVESARKRLAELELEYGIAKIYTFFTYFLRISWIFQKSARSQRS